MEKKIGRITSATFGHGGYQDAQLGLSLTFEGKGWGVSDFQGMWSGPPSESSKWTLGEQGDNFADVVRLLGKTLTEARKRHVGELVGTPVEVTLEGNMLKSWRVLTEVLP